MITYFDEEKRLNENLEAVLNKNEPALSNLFIKEENG